MSCTTLAAIGTAETPAAPIIGLTFDFVKRFIAFAIRMPVIVAVEKAKRPNTNIPSVSGCRKTLPGIVEPTAKPSTIIVAFISEFSDTSAKRGTTPDTRIKLPSISIAINGDAEGTITLMMIVVRTGKMINVRRDGGSDGYSILIRLSCLVVSRRINGGWIIGTSAM